jgi:hypothetical protein
VNVGGEPDRDDSGLPPVDIEIPDDARELDRDVQAYHRELRAQRRRLRARRLHWPLTKDGMVLPLLAGCLVLALISGTLLTLFTSGQGGLSGLTHRPAASPSVTGPAAASGRGQQASTAPSAGSGSGSASQAAPPTPSQGLPATTAAAGQVGGPLPDREVIVAGKNTSLRALPPAVLALIPAGCECSAALRKLAAEAAQAHVPLYLVGSGPDSQQLAQAATSSTPRTARLTQDPAQVLSRTYQKSGLTAVLVHANGSVVRVLSGLGPQLQLTQQLRLLSPAPSPAS